MRDAFQLLFIIVLISLSGCGNATHQISGFVEFSKEGFPQDCWMDLSPDLSDSTIDKSGYYKADIFVRFTNVFPYENLLLQIEEETENQETPLRSEIIIPLFKNGRIKNSESHYGVFETTQILHDKIKLSDFYKIFVKTPMDSTSGLISLGVVFSPINDLTH